MRSDPESDPIGYVLTELWRDFTSLHLNPAASLTGLVQAKAWPDALALAIAMELHRAKCDDDREFWEHADKVSAEDKRIILDELGRRTLFGFLLANLNSYRSGPVTPPSPSTPTPSSPPSSSVGSPPSVHFVPRSNSATDGPAPTSSSSPPSATTS